MGKIPTGQCRYCSNAVYVANNYAICGASGKYNGSTVRKTSKRTSCEGFAFCECDVFSPDYMPDGEIHVYSPKEPAEETQIEGQMNIFDFI